MFNQILLIFIRSKNEHRRRQVLKFAQGFMGFIIVFYPIFTSAQNNCECPEEKKRLPEIIQCFNTGKVEDAVRIFEEIRRVGSPECRLAYCNSMAQYYFNKNETAKVKPLMEEERRLLDSISCGKMAYSRHFSTYGNYYFSLNNYEKAADCFLEALGYSEGTGNLFGQQRSLMSVANVFSRLGQYDKSLVYLNRAETLTLLLIEQSKAGKITVKNNFNNELGMVLSRKAGVYNNLFEQNKTLVTYLDSALITANESIRLGFEVQNQHTVCDGFFNLASQAKHTNQFAKALQYTDSVLAYAPNALLEKYRFDAFGEKSEIYRALKNYPLAAAYADSALVAAEKFNPQMVVTALQLVHETQVLVGNPTRALAAYDRFTVLKDSLLNIDKFNTINELEQQYNKVKNEKSITELTQERQIFQLRNRQLLFGFLLAALTIVAMVFFQRQRALKAKQAVLETEQRLNRARMNPHFFFNALGALQGLALKNNDGRSIVTHLSKFAAIMRQTLESTYTEYIPLEQETRYLQQYLDLQKLRFPDTFDYTIDIADDLDETQVQIPPMLIQPFAENAIEHGFSGQMEGDNHLAIRFSTTPAKELLLEIDDNGQGLKSTTERTRKHVSRATDIIKDRLQIINQQEQSNARFEIKNKAEGGVVVQIYLPLKTTV
jgi:tetratricopeptide (TPR) repeat protein